MIWSKNERFSKLLTVLIYSLPGKTIKSAGTCTYPIFSSRSYIPKLEILSKSLISSNQRFDLREFLRSRIGLVKRSLRAYTRAYWSLWRNSGIRARYGPEYCLDRLQTICTREETVQISLHLILGEIFDERFCELKSSQWDTSSFARFTVEFREKNGVQFR